MGSIVIATLPIEKAPQSCASAGAAFCRHAFIPRTSGGMQLILDSARVELCRPHVRDRVSLPCIVRVVQLCVSTRRMALGVDDVLRRRYRSSNRRMIMGTAYPTENPMMMVASCAFIVIPAFRPSLSPAKTALGIDHGPNGQ